MNGNQWGYEKIGVFIYETSLLDSQSEMVHNELQSLITNSTILHEIQVGLYPTLIY